jgi:hypothetical protein
MKKILLCLCLINFVSKNGYSAGVEEYAISGGFQKAKGFLVPAVRSLFSRVREKVIGRGTNLALGALKEELQKTDPVIAVLRNVVGKKGVAVSIVGAGLSGSMFLYELYLQHKKRQNLMQTIVDLEQKIESIKKNIVAQKLKIKIREKRKSQPLFGTEPTFDTGLDIAQDTLKVIEQYREELEEKLKKNREELAKIPVRLVRKFIGSFIGVTAFAAIGITAAGAGAAADWLLWLKMLRVR